MSALLALLGHSALEESMLVTANSIGSDFAGLGTADLVVELLRVAASAHGLDVGMEPAYSCATALAVNIRIFGRFAVQE